MANWIRVRVARTRGKFSIVVAILSACVLTNQGASASRDAAGNPGVLGALAFTTAAAAAPTVSIITPVANATVSGFISVTATASAGTV